MGRARVDRSRRLRVLSPSGARTWLGVPAPTLTTPVALLALMTLVLAACSSGSHSGVARPGVHGGSPSAMTTRPPTTTTVPPTTTTTEQPGWSPVSTLPTGIAVDQRTVAEPDGSQVTVARFRAGQVHFGLHVGSEDPPTDGVAIPADAGDAVSPAEAPGLVAAFNGGFKVADGAGGFEVGGQVLSPLLDGMTSFVIDADGSGHIGVWGQGVPAPGEQVVSVRQNLPPLVTGSAPSPQISDVAAWGATLGGVTSTARSALGEDAAGDLLYAASMDALPVDLADALVSVGATTAMELDINPEWVQLDLAPAPGGALVIGVPGQNRPADQYQEGWTRDFVTVLAGP